MNKIYAKVTFNPLMKRALVRNHKKATKDLLLKAKGSFSERASSTLNDVNEAMGRTMDYMSSFGSAGSKGFINPQLPSNGLSATGAKTLEKTWQVVACNASRPVKEYFAFDEEGIYKKDSQGTYQLTYPWKQVTARHSWKYLFFYTSTDYALVIPRSAFEQSGDDGLCLNLWEKAQIKRG